MKRLLLPALAVAALFAGTNALAQSATLDQAKELVKKGRAYLRDNGCEKAFKEINEGSMFKNAAYKELYLYVYDKNLVNLAHGGNPRLVGKDLKEMKDTKGRLLNQELLKAAM